ncbi:MAG: hypothetical protein WC511_00860 [Candidatus Pacearchaeota archaeon]
MNEEIKFPTDLEILKLIESHKHKDFRNEFENITEILSNTKHLGFQKVEIIKILDYSLYNLKLPSQIFFRNHLKQLKESLNLKEGWFGDYIRLYKAKGKEKYLEAGSGGNRIFFLKHFPELVDNRNWVWADIIEVNLEG